MFYLRLSTFQKVALACLLFWMLAMGAALAIWDLIHSGNAPGHRQAISAERAARELFRLPARPEDIPGQALATVDADAARALNAATPFAEVAPPPARAFRFGGGEQDRARAIDCLAIAAMAEAGGSDDGQRAVIQVILNRVRHPAFAKTVCGVVFQGSARSTGCQFTFTCDGSLARRYSDAAWEAARRRSADVLAGKVYAPVGTATHYHTDWVYPVWSRQLDKIARVGTHLFFRWRGFWGSPEASRIAYRGYEPAIVQLAWLPSHATALAATTTAAAPPPTATMTDETPAPGLRAGEKVGNAHIVARNPIGGIFLVHLQGTPTPDSAKGLGRQICGDKGYCRVWGWVEAAAVPQDFPVSREARARLSFSYVLDTNNAEYVFYDCRLFTDVKREDCLAIRS